MRATAAECWVYAVSAINSRSGEIGEYFPELERIHLAARRDRRMAVWSAITGLPQAVTRRLSHLVPASLRAALKARAEAQELAGHIVRLENVAPHMLDDIGLKEVSHGFYVVIGQEQAVAAPLPVKPATIRFDPPLPTPVARKPTEWMPRIPTVRPPALMAGVVPS